MPTTPSWPPACPPRRRSPPRSPVCHRRRRCVRGAPCVHPRVRLRGRSVFLGVGSQSRLSGPRGASFTAASSSPRARRHRHSPSGEGPCRPAVSSLSGCRRHTSMETNRRRGRRCSPRRHRSSSSALLSSRSVVGYGKPDEVACADGLAGHARGSSWCGS